MQALQHELEAVNVLHAELAAKDAALQASLAANRRAEEQIKDLQAELDSNACEHWGRGFVAYLLSISPLCPHSTACTLFPFPILKASQRILSTALF